MKIIPVIGYSGSGKTYFILNAIKSLEKHLNLRVAVIKNIHEHQIDKEGKDSFLYSEEGAVFSITKNNNDETVIFIKKEVDIIELVNWLSNGPFPVDILFAEGFRELNYPSILCIKDYSEIKKQINNKIKLITGLILKEKTHEAVHLGIPLLNLHEDFIKFKELFDLSKKN